MESSVTLSPQQRDKIRSYLAAFRNYMGGDQFGRDQQDRQDRTRYFQKELPSKLPPLSQAEVDELITKLWSSRIWGKEQYLVQLILSKNGLDRLREEFTHLVAVSTSQSQSATRAFQGRWTG